jgi:hypothetical protein
VLRAYATFYNPINTLRAVLGLRGDSVSAKRLLFQFVGQIGLLMTIPKLVGWARRLRRGPIEPWDGLQPARVPMVDVIDRQPMNWAIERPVPGTDGRKPSLTSVTAVTDRTSARIPLPILNTA